MGRASRRNAGRVVNSDRTLVRSALRMCADINELAHVLLHAAMRREQLPEAALEDAQITLQGSAETINRLRGYIGE